MNRQALIAALVATSWFASPLAAAPATRAPSVSHVRATAPKTAAATRPATKPKLDGAHARVTVGRFGELRLARDVVGRREEPLSPEEETAKQIEKLLRGPLRNGTTGLFVADARTGEPLFAVNADDPLNPASNVKMISTATALELLGPTFRYPTRLLGADPVAGVVHGDVYLLGSHDPTLTIGDLDDIATAVAARGITAIDGNIVVGADPTRDGIFRAAIPIAIHAGAPGEPVIATAPTDFDLVTIKVSAVTAKSAGKPRLTFKTEDTTDATGHARIVLTIAGSLGKAGQTTYSLVTQDRTATAAYAMRAALRGHAIRVSGAPVVKELGDFVGDSVGAGPLPAELGRHESAPLAEIISNVNKWSINWLADRVIMTAAALARHRPPSMELALDEMYSWLARHPHLAKSDVVVDTGSGLSYHTQISAHELVSVLRSAAGFAGDADPALGPAWLDSLSVAGTDGTLSHRFRAAEMRGRIRGKTGTLSTVIALSGILDIDPQRPLAFSLVTNGDAPLAKGYVRKAHEQVVGLLCKYLATTATKPLAIPAAATAPPPADAPADDVEESEPDAEPAPAN